MERAKAIMLLGALLGTSLSLGVPAEATELRCRAVATGITASGCRYEATGPGLFSVATATGFVVSISRNGGPYIAVAQGEGAVVAASEIPSKAGDMVEIAIRVATVRSPSGSVLAQVQDGVITASE